MKPARRKPQPRPIVVDRQPLVVFPLPVTPDELATAGLALARIFCYLSLACPLPDSAETMPTIIDQEKAA